MTSVLDGLRQKIQKIDVELVDLLRQRMNIVLKIGQVKTEQGFPMQDNKREKEVISNVLKLPHDPIPSKDLLALFQHIIDICLDAQQKSYVK
ncbi:chorismate mutase [bacterium]|nr:chorismate mutase [bacterium]